MRVDETYWNCLGKFPVTDIVDTIKVPMLMGSILRGLTLETRGFTIELYENHNEGWIHRLYVLRNGRRWVENNNLYEENATVFKAPEPFSIDSIKWVFRTYAIEKLIKDHALDRMP